MRIIRLSSAPSVPPPPITAPLKSAFSSSTLVYPRQNSTTLKEDRKSYLLTVISASLLPPLLYTSSFPDIVYHPPYGPTGVEKGPKAVAINLNDIADTNVSASGTRDEMDLVYMLVYYFNTEAEVNCTSSSQAEYHSSFLPEPLRPTLLSLPLSPPTPILLLVSAILLFLTTAVFIAGLIPWKCSVSFDCLHRKQPLPADPHWSCFRSPYQKTDGYTDSSENLVQSSKSRGNGRGTMIRRERPHLAFFTLVCIALGLTAGSLVQLHIVRRAQDVWGNQEGMEVGMVWEMGVLTYLLPILPICLILTLFLAGLPCIYTYLKNTFRNCPADHDNDGDDYPVPDSTTDTEIKLGELGRRWDQTPIINPSPVYVSETYDLPQVRIESKRSTMESVGKAL
ncbi:hypothetical protein L486_00533 [Kwoniella mangroviensis CBS 10435]|uniref:Uncharacterized protein n=1 Tax=Kwoniella mangroviensis CBS 10435 TaxID=1331196 RepID=A0A1B9IZD3_9TREE|nr:hypothetical protein L486_00533 [Kwoniella mangroviensis CBS 10435]